MVADPAQEPVGDPRRAARAAPYLKAGIPVYVHSQKLRGPCNDVRQILNAVEIKVIENAESRTQRRGQQTGTGGRPDDRKRFQMKLDRLGIGPLIDDEIDLKILHCRIEKFFDDL